MRICVCRSAGCRNQDIEFLWDYDTDAQRVEADGVLLGPPWCGACSSEITDVRDHVGDSTGEGGFTATEEDDQ